MLSAVQCTTAVGLEEARWLSARLGQLTLVALAGSNLEADWVYVPIQRFSANLLELENQPCTAPRDAAS